MSAQIMAYKCLEIPAFSHFLYRGNECMINERGVLLVRNEQYDEWIRLNETEYQTEYCTAHPEEIRMLVAVKWHLDPYLDSDETWEIYQKSLRGIGPDSRVG
ncbi:MAG: hypothetical protein MJ116_05470 [Lachnospiraceae bacterium]|nr:hypothetical protein [Lachnospiraceae bacterium]